MNLINYFYVEYFFLMILHKKILNYFEIVGAISLSYIVFGYVPNFQAILGLFVIIGSGLYVSWHVMKNNQGDDQDKEKLIEPL